MLYVVLGVLGLICLWGIFFRRPSEQAAVVDQMGQREAAGHDWKRNWDSRLTALQGVLGPADDRILTGLPPFYLGGPADVLTFRQHLQGACYVTAAMIGDDRVEPNQLGQYELMVCLRKPDDWAPNLISNLAPYTTQAVLQPGNTMHIAPGLPEDSNLSHFLFLPYSQVKVDGKDACVLLCLGITEEEFEHVCDHGPDLLVDELKKAKVYPFTDLTRESVLVAE